MHSTSNKGDQWLTAEPTLLSALQSHYLQQTSNYDARCSF
jgi:hypothetical protein